MPIHQINQISGIAESYLGEGYAGASGINPNNRVAGRLGGVISPQGITQISDTVKDVLWMVPNDINDSVYYYTKDGVFGIVGGAVIGTLTNASGNGLAYYNNYYYIATDTDVARYGPIEGTPTLVEEWWTSQDGLQALGSETYPTVGGFTIPNHPMHVHPNSALYVADYQERGLIHELIMVDLIQLENVDGDFFMGETITGGTSGATGVILAMGIEEKDDELYIVNKIGEFEVGEEITGTTSGTGDVVKYEVGNGPVKQAMNELTLTRKAKPVGMEVVGLDIGVLTTDDSRLFLWDTLSTEGFHTAIEMPFNTATAIKSYNGVPHIWGGSKDDYSIVRYMAGQVVEPIRYMDNGNPPLQGAITNLHKSLLWGADQTYPITKGCLWSLGTIDRMSGVHSIRGVNGQISAVYGDITATSQGLFTSGDTYSSVWRSEVVSFGRPFTLRKVYISVGKELIEGDDMRVKFLYDNETKSSEEYTIDSSYSRNLVFSPLSEGVQNLIIEIKLNSNIPIMFPIIIDFLTND